MTLEFFAPRTVAEACALAREPGTVFMAGGTDVIVFKSKERLRAARVVSLAGLPELREWRVEQDQTLVLGAGVTHQAVATDPGINSRFPALAAACASVGSWATRTAATLGGNVCTAAPSADSAGPLLAYGARVVVTDGATERVLPLSDFITGPGQTALRPGELLLRLLLNDPGPHGWSFLKLGRRRAVDLALVSVTAVVWAGADGDCRGMRVALGAVAPVPLLLQGLDELATGRPWSTELVDEVAASAVSQCRPISDIRASAEYRRRMVGVLTRRALIEAWERAQRAGGGS